MPIFLRRHVREPQNRKGAQSANVPEEAATVVEATASLPPVDPAIAAVQRHTLLLLFTTQIIGGIGLAIGFAVGALLAADIAGIAMSGLAQSSAVVGSALLAVPATRLVRQHGRRPSLAALYVIAAVGGAAIVAAAVYHSVPLLFLGFFMFGGGTTAGLQARYAAIDLAPTPLRGRHLSLIVWATTLGAVAGPNLAPIAGTALQTYGVPTLAAPFAFSVVLFGFAAGVLLLMLRPDPMVVARSLGGGPASIAGTGPGSLGMRAALGAVVTHPSARLGMAATAVGHLVMIGVMAMTPVHILTAGHDPPHTLRIVGVVLSVHIAGMFALAPLTGWLADRFGRRPVILGGIALLLVACGVAGSAGHDPTQLAAGLTLLGMGWSGTMVAGSTLLTESVPSDLRPSAQGLSDLTMGLAGASAGALSGLVMQGWGYPMLTLVAAITTIPLAAAALRSTRNRRTA